MTPVSKIPLPCGSWPSPIIPKHISGKTLTFSELKVEDETIFWLERRPENQGKTVLVQWNKEGYQDLTPTDFDIGSRVHEYGGGAYNVRKNWIVFSDRITNALWLIKRNEEPFPLCQNPNLRFADFFLTDHFVICVQEDHRYKEPKNTLVAFFLDKTYQQGIPLIQGANFYSSPCLSPDQTQLAWIEWSHPFMPWESTQIGLAELNPDLSIHSKRILVGKEQQESLIDLGWTKNQHLLVCSDRNGWWNLYEIHFKKYPITLDLIAPIPAEIGSPPWIFSQKSWYEIKDHQFIAQRIQKGLKDIVVIDKGTVKPLQLESPETCPIPFNNQELVWIDTSTNHPPQIILQDYKKHRHILRSSSSILLSPEFISQGEAICFPTQDGQSSHAFFYPPKHQEYCPLKGELPPLLVMVHGGPTGQADLAFSYKIQWWTSRGFAVIDVNYRGSSGFGRSYREALNQQWGIIDVQDCIDACTYLINNHKVDPKRILIRGGSAGGFTVLTALIQSSIFVGGACLYGVADLTALTKETHKFESHYLDRLIGPYPENLALYKERSPLTYLDRLQCPLIIFQGLDDAIVPPSQADHIVHILKKNHIPYAYYRFAGEGHGFRQEKTIERILELELSFYGEILGFQPNDIKEKVKISK